jgi:hypothetical protein
MFKELFALTFAFLLASTASAGISVISPVEQTLSENHSLSLGTMQAGETAELIFSKETLLGDSTKWSVVEVDSKLLPKGWVVEEISETQKTFVVKFSVPPNAKQNIYNLKFVFSNPSENIAPQSFNFRVSVSENLLSLGIQQKNPGAEIFAGSPITYILSVSNSSIAPHKIVVESSLSEDWFPAEEIIIPPKSSINKELFVQGKVYGKKDFSFIISSALNNSLLKKTSQSILIKPTIESKYSAALYGFPFFTSTLLPYYSIVSFFSLLFL